MRTLNQNLVSANKLTFASRLPESMLQHGDDRWVSAEPVVPADPKVVEVGNECADRCERRGLVKGEVRPAVRCRAPRIGAGRVVGGAGYTSEFRRRASGFRGHSRWPREVSGLPSIRPATPHGTASSLLGNVQRRAPSELAVAAFVGGAISPTRSRPARFASYSETSAAA